MPRCQYLLVHLWKRIKQILFPTLPVWAPTTLLVEKPSFESGSGAGGTLSCVMCGVSKPGPPLPTGDSSDYCIILVVETSRNYSVISPTTLFLLESETLAVTFFFFFRAWKKKNRAAGSMIPWHLRYYGHISAQ